MHWRFWLAVAYQKCLLFQVHTVYFIKYCVDVYCSDCFKILSLFVIINGKGDNFVRGTEKVIIAGKVVLEMMPENSVKNPEAFIRSGNLLNCNLTARKQCQWRVIRLFYSISCQYIWCLFHGYITIWSWKQIELFVDVETQSLCSSTSV